MITYTLNKFGLRDKDMRYLEELFASIPNVERVVIYGSRATGNYEKASDIDLAVFGKNVTLSDISNIHYSIENESPMLLWADVLKYESIKNEELKKRIDMWGIEIYNNKSQ